MRSEPRHVPIPTEEDITRAIATHPQRGVVAVAGTTKAQLIYLNLGLRTGRIETVYLDAIGAGHLIAVLKALVPTKAGIAASPVTVAIDGESEAQAGELRDEEGDE
jgi:hypothetical protein